MVGQNSSTKSEKLVTRFPSLTGKAPPTQDETTRKIYTASSRHADASAQDFLALCKQQFNGQHAIPSVIHAAWAHLLRCYVGQEAVGFLSAAYNDDDASPAVSHFTLDFMSTTTNNDLVGFVEKTLSSCSPLAADEVAGALNGSSTVLSTRKIDKLNSLKDDLWSNSESDVQKPDLQLHFSYMDSAFEITLTWSSALFSQSHGDRLILQLRVIMDFIAASPAKPALSLDFDRLPEHELSIVNPSPVRRLKDNEDGPKLLHHFFEMQAEKYPDRPALEFLHSLETRERTLWTYSELNSRATRLSQHLLSLFNLQPDDKIPIFATLSPNSYVAILAILKAGCAYVPLSSDSPVDRVQFVAGDVDAKLMLTDAACLGKCAGLDVTLVNMDDPEVSQLMSSTAPIDPEAVHKVKVQPGHLAYCMYTSGSTGKPKGVQLMHKNGVESILAHHPIIPHSPPDANTHEKWLHFAALTFDVSVYEIFFPFSTAMCIATTTREQLLSRLEDTMNELQVTHTELTPTVAGVITRKNVPTVKTLLTIGEMLTQYVVDEWAVDGSLHNAYGPTECAIHCTMAASFDPTVKPSNIGLPLDSCTLYVMTTKNLYNTDTRFSVPVGFVGELYVGGDQVARGYINRPEATAAAFFPDPANPGDQIYATGDLVRLLDNGTMEFVGRVSEDEQVKLRGQRIELGEISHVVARAHPAISSVATIVIATGDNGQGSKLLVTFVAVRFDDAHGFDEKQICEVDTTKVYRWQEVEDACLDIATKTLPPYMIPNTLILISDIPRNLSGKTDRKVLQRIYAEYRVATSSTEEELDDSTLIEESIWTNDPTLTAVRDVLAKLSDMPVQRMRPQSSLPQLGIDSLGAMVLCARLRENGMNVTVGSVLQNPTVEGIAKAITLHASQASFVDRTLANSWSDLPVKVADELGVSPSQIHDVYPCVPVQDAMITENLKTSGRRYMNSMLWKIDGKHNDFSRIQRAWENMVANVDALRTGFVLADGYEQPSSFLQVVWKPSIHRAWDGHVQVQTEQDLHKSVDLHKREARQWGRDANLSIPPVFCRLIQCVANGTTYLSLVMHHAIHDGWSVPLLMRGLQEHLTGAPISPRPGSRDMVQYYYAHQPAAAEEFWVQAFADVKTADVGSFPKLTTTSLPSTDTIHVTRMTSVMSSSMFDQCCSAMNSSPQVLVQIAWARLLSQYTGKHDTMFGTVLSGRGAPVDGVDQLVGCLTQVIPCFVRVTENNVQGMLERVGKHNIGVLDHAWIKVARIATLLNLEAANKDFGKQLFDTFVIYQKVSTTTASEQLVSVIDSEDLFEHHIMMEIEPKGDDLILTIRCQDNIVPASHAQTLLDLFQHLLVDTIQKGMNRNLNVSAPTPSSVLTPPASPTLANLEHALAEYAAEKKVSRKTVPDDTPWTETELKIRALMAGLAKVTPESIGRNTTLFQLGLDSIGAIQLSSRLRKQEDIHLSMIDIMQNPTVGRLGKILSSRSVAIFTEVDEVTLDSVRAQFNKFSDEVRDSLRNATDRPPHLELSNVECIYPCVAMQESMWAKSLHDSNRTYLNQFTLDLEPFVDELRLKEAWKQVIAQNDVLRTTIIHSPNPADGHLFAQVVCREPDIRWEVLTLDHMKDLEATKDKIQKDLRANGLLAGPPLAFSYVKSPLEAALVVTIHHAIFDGTSWSLMLEDVSNAYYGKEIAKRAPFSWAVERIVAKTVHDSQAKEMWKAHLNGYEPAPFPDVSGAPSPDDEYHEVEKTIAMPLSEMEGACRALGTTLQSIGIAAWSAVLSAYLGKKDVVFGLVLSGRNGSDDEWVNVVGPCINTLPCRIQTEGNETYKDLLNIVNTEYSELLSQQHTPLRSIQRWVGATDGHPLFDTLFLYDKRTGTDETNYNVPWFKHFDALTAIETAIAMEMTAIEGKGLVLFGGFRNSVLSRSQSAILCEQFESIFIDILTSSQKIVASSLPRSLQSITNAPATHFKVPPHIKYMHSWVEHHAQHHPSHVALEFAYEISEQGNRTSEWTFKELNEKANQIANYLLSHGVKVEDKVPICMPRCPWLYASILGVSKAGAGYVPIDPDSPADRKQYILEDTQALLILTSAHLRKDFQDGVTLIELDNPETEMEVAGHSAQNPTVGRLGPENLAYVLYTSGTSGVPKGVLVEHRNVVQATAAFCDLIPFTADSKLLQMASIAFDVSVFEFMLSWSNAIRLCAAPKEVILKDLELTIRSMKVSHADLTPSLASTIRCENIPTMKLLVSGGEALTRQVLNEWVGRVRVCNGYGPTEATIGCTMLCGVQRIHKTNNIGSMYKNASGFIMAVDRPLNPVMRGAQGELCVGGPLVSRGYLNRDDLTEAAFVYWKDPLSGTVERLYRTGDLARLMPDDTIEFLGRASSGQVKINGIRIELDEVSQVLKDVNENVRTAVTLMAQHPQLQKTQLISFIVLRDQPEAAECVMVEEDAQSAETLSEIMASAKRKLPLYMVPRRILLINRIPVGPTGKIDDKLLVRLYQEKAAQRSGDAISDTRYSKTEEILRGALARVAKMAVEEVTRSMTIFELGVDSLSSIAVSALLRKEGIDLAVSDILQLAVVGDIAAFIDSKRAPVGQQEKDARLEKARRQMRDYSTLVTDVITKKLDITPDEISCVYPCTALQEGMITQTLHSSESLYINHFVFRIEDTADVTKLEEAWMQVIATSEMLRTAFQSVEQTGGYAQYVYKSVNNSLHNWVALECATHEQVLENVRLWKTDVLQGLEAGVPPLRTRLVQVGSERIIVLIIHHALYDGFSLPLLLEDVQKRYFGLSVVPRTPFSAFIEHALASDADADSSFWKQKLQNCTTVPFPSLTRTRIADDDPTVHHVTLSSRLSLSHVENACKQLGTTVQALGISAWAKLLSYYVGETDVTVGLVLSGRTIPVEGVEHIAAPCFNTIPFRVQLDNAQTNRDLVRNVNADNSAVLQHQHASLRSIQKWVDRSHDRPLFDTLFLYQKGSPEDELRQFDPVWQELDAMADPEYPISIELSANTSGELTMSAACKGNFMTKEQSQQMLNSLDALMTHIVEHPDAIIKDIEDAQFPMESLSISNHSPTEFTDEETGNQLTHGLFERHAATHPDNIALEWTSEISANTITEKWTYDELDREANKVANLLVSTVLTASSIESRLICISMDKSPLLYAAILGVLKSGAAYIPIDPALPSERKRYMMSDSGAKCVLTNQRWAENFGQGIDTIILDDSSALSEQQDTKPTVDIPPEHLAYCLYTSGSTGLPKGVKISHKSTAQCLKAFAVVRGIWHNTRYLQFATCSFDVSIYEMFSAWNEGMVLCSAPQDVMLQDLELTLNVLKITHFGCSPSLAALIRKENVPHLRVLASGGEALTHKVASQWAGHDDFALANAYGPSECTIGCTLNMAVKADAKPNDIGNPLPSCSAYVIGSNMQVLPIGAIGELVIGGINVAEGYLNRPELTAEKFINLKLPGGKCVRAYRTGDFTSMLADGSLLFAGRMDSQIKLNGIRIELSEISTVLSQADEGVENIATLVLRHPQLERDQLISFISLKRSAEERADQQLQPQLIPLDSTTPPSLAPIQKAMGIATRRLPMYMVPARMFIAQPMPIGNTGKIDNNELKKMFTEMDVTSLIAGEADGEADSGAWTQDELKMRKILARVANIPEDSIGKRSSIFQLGLDSISAIRLVANSKEEGFQLLVSDIMRHATIERMLAFLSEKGSLAGDKNVEEAENLVEHRKMLKDFEKRALDAVAKGLGVERDALTAAYPCTPLQEGMIAHTLISNGELYLNHTVLDLDAAVDTDKLRQAWTSVIANNDILRTSFHSIEDSLSTQVQVVHRDANITWSEVSVASEEELATVSESHIQKITEYLRSLQQPPIAFGVINGPTSRKLILTLHHAMYDGFSLPQILQDVALLYRGVSLSRRPSFRNIVEYITSRPEEESRAYWTSHLENATPSLIPDDLRGTFLRTNEKIADQHIFSMPLASLAAKCQELQVSLQSVGQAAWGKLLSGYLGEPDVMFGHVVSGRLVPVEGAEKIIGPAFNTIPCRVRLHQDSTNEDLLREVHNANVDGILFQHTPLKSITKWSGLSGGQALFNTLFVFQSNEQTEGDDILWTIADGKVELDYSLALEMVITGEEVILQAACKLEIMPKEHLRLVLQQLDGIIVDLLTRPESSARSYGTHIPEAAMAKINRNVSSVLGNDLPLLHSRIEEHGMKIPDHPALQFATGFTAEGRPVFTTLTYGEINRKANQLAHMLLKGGVSSEQIIPICLDRSPWMYIAIYAVLKAGAAYVPIDPAAPIDRKRYIISDVAATLMITSPDLLFELMEDAPDCENLSMLCVDDDLEPVLASFPETAPAVEIKARHLAYCLYTSGTTGQPKGVLIEHGSAASALAELRMRHDLRLDSKMLQFASSTFDVSVYEMFAGVTLVTAGKDHLLSNLSLLIQTAKVTLANLTPTLVSHTMRRADLPSLELLCVGGESLTQRILDEWTGMLANAYGPTECTIGCTILLPVPTNARPSNIGKAFDSCSAFVLSDALEILPRGAVGELCIAGPQVARGYLGRPQLTAEKFVEIPDIGRVYRTGDVVKLLADDTVIFLGRKDEQVKMNGLRIEMGEITAVMAACRPEVTDAVTFVLRHPQQSRDQIVSFIAVSRKNEDASEPVKVLAEGDDASLAVQVVQSALVNARSTLPVYMVPSSIIVVNKLPRGLTNKADRAALAAMFYSASLADIAMWMGEEADSGVWTELEETIQGVLAEVSKLPLADVGRTTSIFHLGLDSISAILVTAKLRKRGLHLAVGDILQNPTIKQMALAELAKRSEDLPLNAPTIEITSVVAATLGESFTEHHLLDILKVERANILKVLPITPGQQFTISGWMALEGKTFMPSFSFVTRERFNAAHLKSAWKAVVQRHEILRTCFVPTQDATIPIVQVVLAEAEVDWTEIALEKDFDLDSVTEHISLEQSKRVGLQTPPIRLRLVRFADAAVFMITLHHALYDGVSISMLKGDLEAAYDVATGGQSSMAELGDFNAFVEHTFYKSQDEIAQQYWKSHLENCSPTILPAMNADVSDAAPTKLLKAGAIDDITAYEYECVKLGVTFQSMMLAAWGKVLGDITDTDNPVYGMYHSGRSAPVDGIEHLMAPTINILPLAVSNARGQDLVEIARNIQKDLAQQHTHTQISMSTILGWAGHGTKPMLNTYLNYLRLPSVSGKSAGGEVFELIEWNASSVDRMSAINLQPQTSVPFRELFDCPLALPQTDLDIEISIRGSRLDLGVFCESHIISKEKAEMIVKEMCDMVTKALSVAESAR
ncbi:hypothetical protein DFJ77DRAFT_279005 [Powellomyces hirtus]|nr:hypothetical protein DFJ77DRAFT_279005 [Powellomyces hirtus]